jgi:hypothetical protein
MAVNVIYTKVLELLKRAGIDPQKFIGTVDPNKIKKLTTKTETTATKPRLIDALTKDKKTFSDALDIFKNEAKYLSQLNEMELTNFANNLQDYFTVGGKVKYTPSNVVTTEGTPVVGKKLKNLSERKGAKDKVPDTSSLQGSMEGLMSLVDDLKGISPKMRNQMNRDELAKFIQKMRGKKFTNDEVKLVREYMDEYGIGLAKEKGAPAMEYARKLGAKNKEEFKFIEEYLDTIESYSPKEFKDMFDVKKINMDISDVIEKKLEKHFKKKYKWDDTKKDGGLDEVTFEKYEDEVYETGKEFGDFHRVYDTDSPRGIFGVRESTSWVNNPKNYLDEASEKLQSITGDGLNVDFYKKYTDDVLTKYPKPEKFQYGGPVIKGPDMGATAHGSGELLARSRMFQPGGQTTTSTGLNYLLGEDDATRIPFQDGLSTNKIDLSKILQGVLPEREPPQLREGFTGISGPSTGRRTATPATGLERVLEIQESIKADKGEQNKVLGVLNYVINNSDQQLAENIIADIGNAQIKALTTISGYKQDAFDKAGVMPIDGETIYNLVINDNILGKYNLDVNAIADAVGTKEIEASLKNNNMGLTWNSESGQMEGSWTFNKQEGPANQENKWSITPSVSKNDITNSEEISLTFDRAVNNGDIQISASDKANAGGDNRTLKFNWTGEAEKDEDGRDIKGTAETIDITHLSGDSGNQLKFDGVKSFDFYNVDGKEPTFSLQSTHNLDKGDENYLATAVLPLPSDFSIYGEKGSDSESAYGIGFQKDWELDNFFTKDKSGDNKGIFSLDADKNFASGDWSANLNFRMPLSKNKLNTRSINFNDNNIQPSQIENHVWINGELVFMPEKEQFDYKQDEAFNQDYKYYRGTNKLDEAYNILESKDWMPRERILPPLNLNMADGGIARLGFALGRGTEQVIEENKKLEDTIEMSNMLNKFYEDRTHGKHMTPMPVPDVDARRLDQLPPLEFENLPYVPEVSNTIEFDDGTVYYKDTGEFYTSEGKQVTSPSEGAKPVVETLEAADGGIARLGFAGGKLVDASRRSFLKFVGGTAASIAALKTGLVKLMGGKNADQVKKVIDEVVIAKETGAPDWFQPLVNKILREGKDANITYGERQIGKTMNTPSGKVDVVYKLDTGDVELSFVGKNTALGEQVDLVYKPGQVIEEGKFAGKKEGDEFIASETVPESHVTSYGDDVDYIIDAGAYETGNVGNLASDLSELKTFATGEKQTIKEIVEGIKKKKVRETMEKDPGQYLVDQYGDIPYASGGLAGLIGE